MNVLSELPLGFGMALAQYPEAMKSFSDMDKSQKQRVLDEIHGIESKKAMQAYVKTLANNG